ENRPPMLRSAGGVLAAIVVCALPLAPAACGGSTVTNGPPADASPPPLDAWLEATSGGDDGASARDASDGSAAPDAHDGSAPPDAGADGPLLTILQSPRGVYAYALAGSDIYWSTGAGAVLTSHPFESPAAAVTLATGQLYADPILVNTTDVYWPT